MTGEVYSVQADDKIENALQAMQERKVRRLPVVNSEGELEGILSMNDIVLHATPGKGDVEGIDYRDVIKTYSAICQHASPAAQSATAS